MSAFVESENADALEKSLDGGVGTFQIEAENGRYTLALAQDRLCEAIFSRRARRLQRRLAAGLEVAPARALV